MISGCSSFDLDAGVDVPTDELRTRAHALRVAIGRTLGRGLLHCRAASQLEASAYMDALERIETELSRRARA